MKRTNERILLFAFAALIFSTGPSVADVTMVGLSGTMLVPGLTVMPPGTARAAAHLVGSKDSHEGSFKGAFAYTNDCEIAVMKRFVTGSGKSQYDPVFSGKYMLRPNVAVAAVIDTTAGYKDSVMFLTGTPGNRVVLGVGANLGMDETERFSHFGRYTDSSSTVDPFFFVLGGSLNLDPDTEITLDYAGNDFMVGFRHHFEESFAVDFGYYTPDNFTRESRYCLGANFGF